MPQSREPSTPFRDATDLVPADIAFRRFCDIRFAELKTAIARAKETFHAEEIHMMERTDAEFTELLRTGVPALFAVGDRERLIIPHETLETPRLALLFRKSGSQISGQEGPGFAAYAGRIAMISQSQLDEALASKRPIKSDAPHLAHDSRGKPGPKAFDALIRRYADKKWPTGVPHRQRERNAASLRDDMRDAGEEAVPSLSKIMKTIRKLPATRE